MNLDDLRTSRAARRLTTFQDGGGKSVFTMAAPPFLCGRYGPEAAGDPRDEAEGVERKVAPLPPTTFSGASFDPDKGFVYATLRELARDSRDPSLTTV